MHVLGIDAGGTKTVCYLADEGGRVVGESRGGPANLHAVGEAGVEEVLRAVIAEAIGGQKVVPSALCVGMAGAERDTDRRAVERVLRRAGFDGRVLVVNDAFVALSAGVGEGPGVVLVSGTGSIVYGRSARGLAARAGGFGRIFGDEASGYWLGRRALQAVARSSDGRGPKTRLTPLVLAHFGVSQAWDLIQQVNTRVSEHGLVSALAHVVETARAEGDAVAAAILEDAAQELVTAGGCVVDRLGMREDVFGFVLAGGVFKASPWLVEELKGRLPLLAPKATVLRLDVEPAQGAVFLALAVAREGVSLPAYA
jgi:N-acetylglucosamine kinase-like BadF-type ATPase